jgi:hypothetical protein
VTFWSFYFAWYQGGVYGNLIASALTGALTAAFTLWRIRRHHEHTRRENQQHRDDLTQHVTRELAALHAKIDRQQGGAV